MVEEAISFIQKTEVHEEHEKYCDNMIVNFLFNLVIAVRKNMWTTNATGKFNYLFLSFLIFSRGRRLCFLHFDGLNSEKSNGKRIFGIHHEKNTQRCIV
jgi:hypothetical protein